MTITTQDKIKAVQREIGYRERVYSRLVLEGRMTQANADKQINIMKEILKDYEEKAKQEDKQQSLF